MAHFAVIRPLGEFYLTHKLWDKPRGRVLVFHLLIEGLLAGAQGLHPFIERFQRPGVEAGADMPRIDPALLRFVAYSQHQLAEVFARPARLSVPDDNHFLLTDGFELEPLTRSLARVVESRRTLGYYALFVRALRLGELTRPELRDVIAVA